MKPKTKNQIEACRINNKVPEITNSQLCTLIQGVEFPAFNDKDGYVCGCCGNRLKSGKKCPHCGVSLHYDEYFKKHRVDKNLYEYVGLHTKINGWSVDRIFLLKLTIYKNCGYTCEYNEIIRFVGDCFFSKKYNGLGCYTYEAGWSRFSDITLRSRLSYSSEIAVKYVKYPKAKRSDTFVHKKPHLYTILKCHSEDFKYWATHVHYLERFWHVIKTAYRNGITPTEDYIFYLKKQTNMGRKIKGFIPMLSHNQMIRFNEQYKVWLVENNALVFYNHHRQEIERDRRLRQREEYMKEQERKEKEYNKKYIEVHNKYLDIVIASNNLVIKPLQNVDEFKEEGTKMHHCVYNCMYYTKDNSLILSAKDSSGKRLATVEWDLENKKILQCRAECNSVPERYQEICDIVSNELLLITSKIKTA